MQFGTLDRCGNTRYLSRTELYSQYSFFGRNSCSVPSQLIRLGLGFMVSQALNVVADLNVADEWLLESGVWTTWRRRPAVTVTRYTGSCGFSPPRVFFANHGPSFRADRIRCGVAVRRPLQSSRLDPNDEPGAIYDIQPARPFRAYRSAGVRQSVRKAEVRLVGRPCGRGSAFSTGDDRSKSRRQ